LLELNFTPLFPNTSPLYFERQARWNSPFHSISKYKLAGALHSTLFRSIENLQTIPPTAEVCIGRVIKPFLGQLKSEKHVYVRRLIHA
jgi:hypothetical protein